MLRARVVLPLLLLLNQQPAFVSTQPELFKDGGALTNAWADFDADGDLDLFVGFSGTPNRLYQNQGKAAGHTFQDVATSLGVADARATRASAWGDYDADGDVDLFVGFAPGNSSVFKLYRNDGSKFTDVAQSVGIAADSGAVRQPSWIDYDSDGDLDLFVAMRDRPNLMYRNEANRFTNVAAAIGVADTRKSVGAVWFDYDQDGDLDVYVANQDGDANGLFRNDRGRFTDVAEAAGAAWGGRPAGSAANGTVRPCVADVNNDGMLDLFLANYGPNGLLLNRGNGRFEDVSKEWGVSIDGRHDTCDFADFDNDGRIDVYVNGTVTGGVSYRDYLFRNTGSRFDDVTPANLQSMHASHGARWADFDGDFNQDLAIAGTRPDATHSLFRNQRAAASDGSAFTVILRTPRRVVDAGAEIRIYDAQSGRLLGTRIFDTGSGYNSQSVMPVHFGLGNRRQIQVEVTEMSPQGRRVERGGSVDSRVGTATITRR